MDTSVRTDTLESRRRLLALAAGPGGLICAFRFGRGAPRRLNWADIQVPPPAASGEFTWMHLKSADGRIHDWLEHNQDIPEAARAFLAGRDSRPRLHVTDEGVHGLLVDLKMDAEAQDDEKGVLHFFMDGTRLITVRTRALRSTDRLRRLVEDGADYGCTLELLAALLQCLHEGFLERLEALTDEVDDIEASVLSDRQQADRSALSAVRRQLAEFRRHINPERNILGRLCTLGHAWADSEAQDRLAQVIDALHGLAGAIDALYERAKLLQEEIASQMAEQMNRNLMVLSILTALLMPGTLVSGIFGMNMADVPGLQWPGAFWLVLSLMLGLGVGMLLLLKKLKLF
ncbi:CorA family divalent cation transporter [Bordetella bronchialis]|uniref:CorA family divalent cation transporter n=1 Tax=Bordetella bronchialis TaxID=463025 RepID=UPI003CFD3808